ncbi:nucleotidyltransferase domain-containing protein [Gordonia malaquae]|uniref:nucleotidyltransferase domain-containing protein n=1 Tax=Gordonia malaquae TaxID=410332 RepID=UPI0030FE3560
MTSHHKNQDIAEPNTILRGQVGSGLHGVTTGADDRDEMGVCIEPRDYVVGLNQFEQWIYRTQPEGVRSGPGDLDLVVYSLRKWTRLAAAGNPTVLLLGFIPDDELVHCDEFGQSLRDNMDMFLSKQAAAKFIGYCRSQLAQLNGEKSRKHTNRPELIAKYGYDTKFAYHAIRLGVQGREYLATGRITLPMPDGWRTYLTGLRLGEVDYVEALMRIEDQLDGLRKLEAESTLPDRPNMDRINAWLIDQYEGWWTK